MSVKESFTVSKESGQVRSKRSDMAIYPILELAGGIYRAYFTTYISLLMTSVYLFPVTLAGVLESLQSVVGWIAQPLFGIFLDRFSFKKSKYWPWFIIGGAGCGIMYILVFTIPIFSNNPASLAFPVACMIALASILLSCVTQVGMNIYAMIAKGSKERAYLGSAAKFARDGMKVLVGFMFPLMLAAFTNFFQDEVKSWALTALILAGAAIILFIIDALITVKSQLEQEAIVARAQVKKKANKLPLKTILMSIFANPALLVAFIALAASKIFFFFHITGGTYFWKYYMGDFTMMAAFSTVFSLSAIIGAVFVPVFLKYIKDTKSTYVLAFVAQAVIYAGSMLLVSKSNPIQTIIVLSAASFFNGITDSLIMPLFVNSADYAKWKYGTAEVGLTMSIYYIAVKVGLVVSIAVRTYLLAAGGFDSKALAAGKAVPSGVATALFNMNTLYPMILSIIIALLVLFVYPVNDKKLAEIRSEIQAREIQ